MKNIVRLLQELQDYSNSDSVGISLTDSSVVFIFLFDSIKAYSHINLPIETIMLSKMTEEEMKTEILEKVHKTVSDFKRGMGNS